MLLNFLRAALLVISLSSFSAHAVLVTSLSNLDIGGTKYNVTFHSDISFNDLFDKDNDGIFNDNDGSVFNRAPTFFGNIAGAGIAADAIINALGTTDHTYQTTTGNLRDLFYVPHTIFGHTNTQIGYMTDDFSSLTSDSRVRGDIGRTTSNRIPFVSFEAVPTPPTLALAGLALGIMGMMGRRRREC
ncbi:MAG: PEP-CTERM sorting domain-containing protein [Nitrosomonas sp.]|nr:PEP-CTERM sorting domain-containing protein [Nitrosomonas sp.]